MSKVFDINNLNERLKFEVKLQLSLRKNAMNVQEQSKYPDRYMDHIYEREQTLSQLLGPIQELSQEDGNNHLYL